MLSTSVPEAKAEAKAEVEVEAKAEAKPEPKAEAKPEAKKPESVAKPEAKRPERKPEARPFDDKARERRPAERDNAQRNKDNYYAPKPSYPKYSELSEVFRASAGRSLRKAPREYEPRGRGQASSVPGG